MKSVIVATKNIGRLVEASQALITRTPGTPGMGLLFGKSGLGKTTATAWFVNKCDGVYVRALASWTPATMLQQILRELEMTPERNNCASMVMQITKALRISGRPLFIDEFDYIVDDKKMTETLRDIHDVSSTPIILIGMENASRKIQLRDQFVNRIAQFVEFRPIDFDDTQRLARELCEVDIEEDLLKKLYIESKGVVRLVVIGLDAIERRARTLNIKKIGESQWDRDGFFNNDKNKRSRK